MKQNRARTLARYRSTFAALHRRPEGRRRRRHARPAARRRSWSFRWAPTPTYAPLFSNLAAEDASAIVEQLDAEGMPYELSDGGGTIMVPEDQVYDDPDRAERRGPAGAATERLRAARRAGHLDLASSRSRPATSGRWRASSPRPSRRSTASTPPSCTSRSRRRRSSPTSRTRPPPRSWSTPRPATSSTPSRCRRSSTWSPPASTASTPTRSPSPTRPARCSPRPTGRRPRRAARAPAVDDVPAASCQVRLQTMLDRVVGPGNSTVQVTARPRLRQAVTETTTYTPTPRTRRRCRSSTRPETLQRSRPATAAPAASSGPDGQMDSSAPARAPATSAYEKESETQDNAVNTEVERRETAPGSVELAARRRRPRHRGGRGPSTRTRSATWSRRPSGIDPKRGDTIERHAMPFDRTAEDAAAEELAAADDGRGRRPQRWTLIRNGGIGGGRPARCCCSPGCSARRRARPATHATDVRRRAAAQRRSSPRPQRGRRAAAGHRSPSSRPRRDERRRAPRRDRRPGRAPARRRRRAAARLAGGPPDDAPSPPASGVRKAAILLVQLGSERAAKVLGHLTEAEVEAITAEIARLGRRSAPPRPTRCSTSSAT